MLQSGSEQAPLASLHARHALLSRPLNHDELRHVAGRVADELDHQVDVADEEAGLGFRQQYQRVTTRRLRRELSAIDLHGHRLTVAELIDTRVTRQYRVLNSTTISSAIIALF